MINLSQYFTKIKGELYKNTSLAPLTWFKVGGPAEYLFIPENKEDLIAFLKQYPAEQPKTIIGAGSNLLIRDGGIAGVVISMKKINKISKVNEFIYAECGALDMAIARTASKLGISGLEFLSAASKSSPDSKLRTVKEALDNALSITHLRDASSSAIQILLLLSILVPNR